MRYNQNMKFDSTNIKKDIQEPYNAYKHSKNINNDLGYSSEINTNRGKVSLIFSTRVKSMTSFLPLFYRGRPSSLMK